MSVTAKRRPSEWQTEVAWPQRRQWQKFEQRPCECGCGLTEAACLRAGAITGEQLLARARAGHVVLPARPRARIRLPAFPCTVAQDFCLLVLEWCVDHGYKSVWATHEQLAELARLQLGRGSARTSHNAVHQAAEQLYVEIISGHVAGDECRRCSGDGKHGDGSDCNTCSGTGKRPDYARRARTRLNGEACGRERAANFYRPGPAMLAALDKLGWSPAALMRQAEKAAQAERARIEARAELERQAEHQRAADRRQLEQRDTERRSRVRATCDFVAASVAKRPDLASTKALSPNEYSVLHDRVEPVESRRPPAGSGLAEDRQASPFEDSARAPSARADSTVSQERSTEPPAAALSGVSLLAARSPAPPGIAGNVPGAGGKSPESVGEGANGRRSSDAMARRSRPSARSAPSDDELSVEELILRAWRAEQRRREHLEPERPGEADGQAPAKCNGRAGPAEEDGDDAG